MTSRTLGAFTRGNNYVAGQGGQLTLGGPSSGSSIDPDTFAVVAGLKENGTNGDASGYLTFSTSLSNRTLVEHLRITSAGKVGIGTTVPSHVLDIQGTPVSNGSASEILGLVDARTSAAGVGAGITFGGRYDSAGSIATNFASIQGVKENS